MSAYPVMLEGGSISAVIVGGGGVAARKAAALATSGARVRVIAPRIVPEMEAVAAEFSTLSISRAAYTPDCLRGATLVVAATDDRDVNAAVAADARGRGILVNVVDAPEMSDFITPAVHRAGPVVVAVSAGRVPSAAVRIRDDIARRVDARFGTAVEALASMRARLLDAGEREAWRRAAESLTGEAFCAEVESGRLSERLGEWR